MGTPGRLNRVFYLNPLAFCAIALYAIALPAHATTLTVTNTNDNGPGSLRETLASANEGDTITFAVTGSIILTSGELLVDKSITISGPGSSNLIIDGNASSRVFHIAPDQTVSIAGLTVTNGLTSDDGGGIYNDHAILALSDCTITGNAASDGGGVYNDGFEGEAQLTIDSSSVSGNSATARFGSGGGIYNDGTFSEGHATLQVNNSTISENIASFAGGGIDNEGRASVTITNNTINDNSATILGGAIYNDSVHSGLGARITVNSSTFSGNSAVRYGGAIVNDCADIKSLAALTVNQSLFNNNSAGFGGGIYSDSLFGDAEVTLDDSTFSDNSASQSGGAVYNSPSAYGFETMTANNSVFKNNTAGASGGAIYNDQGNSYLTNCSISANTAQKTGGGIYNDGFDGTVRLEIDSSTLNGNLAQVGGGIYNDADHQGGTWLDISNSTISANTASSDGSLTSSGYGGGLASNGDNARFVSVEISNTTFSDNSASHVGGSIYNVGQNDQNAVLVTLANTILKSGPLGGNIFSNSATIESLGYNLSNDSSGGFLTGPGDQTNIDPMLGSLQDNGGPTFTHALLPGSPAIDAGDPNFVPPPLNDQRGPGFDRIVNGRVDVGSFEAQTSSPVPSPRLNPPSRSRPTAMRRRPTPP
jgi:predicted outer membrane repeat protein